MDSSEPDEKGRFLAPGLEGVDAGGAVVRAAGVEPALHKEADFKSAASTSFATPALISLA
jgi:hypothetical protein